MKSYNKVITIIKIILGYIVYFFSIFISRKKNIWIFGSFGVYNDNSRYFYEYCLNNCNDIRSIWISKNRYSVNEAHKKGEAYYLYSIKGVYYALKGGVYIYSSYLSDISFFTSKNALRVNLWHGIPLKKIEFDINSKPLVSIFQQATILTKIIHPAQHATPNLLLSPSKYVSEYSFKNAFRVTDDAMIYARYPRVTKLLECVSMNQFAGYHKVFLYAPTWRDSGKDFIKEANFEFEKFNKFLIKNNSLLLLKLHPSTKINLEVEYSNINLIDNQLDPIILMKTADCLITDYSSIYFDYLYLDRPIIFFCFDKDNYLLNREMYFDYTTITPGKIVNDQYMLINEMNNIIQGKDFYTHERKKCFALFKLEEKNNIDIVKSIKKENI
ncbi:CDP-glycerol glycerophosphotransferase family protein [Proteus mirabilis]|uniref:CDP-glycerol glycerophosphotransferase family protein n=1 Tax=Proteus mirabilis TaxID=584 RepID=UPI0018C63629|nr:CDP-glycerol glycerophosphotransferase family protein [Proteus mirabilis]HBC6251923.1 CDP-glycerol glycerophosphotransferase family protein [Proteus mirabilis]